MHVMTKRGSQDNVVTYEHMCDTIADMQAIPSTQATLGSVAIVLQGVSGAMEVYIADSAHQWSLLNSVTTGAGTSNDTTNRIAITPPVNSATLLDFDFADYQNDDDPDNLLDDFVGQLVHYDTEFMGNFLTVLSYSSSIMKYFYVFTEYTDGSIEVNQCVEYGNTYSMPSDYRSARNSLTSTLFDNSTFVFFEKTSENSADIVCAFRLAPTAESFITLNSSFSIQTNAETGDPATVIGQATWLPVSTSDWNTAKQNIKRIRVIYTNEWIYNVPVPSTNTSSPYTSS